MEITVDGDTVTLCIRTTRWFEPIRPARPTNPALKLGAAQEVSYENPDGLPVRSGSAVLTRPALNGSLIRRGEDLAHGTGLSWVREDRNWDEAGGGDESHWTYIPRQKGKVGSVYSHGKPTE